MKSLLPKNWRKRRNMPRGHHRFLLDRNMEGWQVIDWAYATCMGFDSKAEAAGAKRFYQRYVTDHGDIDLCSAPYGWDDELHYGSVERIERWWDENPEPTP